MEVNPFYSNPTSEYGVNKDYGTQQEIYGSNVISTQPARNFMTDDTKEGIAVNQDPVATSSALDDLAKAKEFLIFEHIDLCEIFTKLQQQAQFDIHGNSYESSIKLYMAAEDSNFIERNCCGMLRRLKMKILNDQKQEIINLDRPFNCQSCCCPRCRQEMRVFSPSGDIIGTIEEKWNLFSGSLAIKDCRNQPILIVELPFLTYSIPCKEVVFHIFSNYGDKREVATIYKPWANTLKECCTHTDNFRIIFLEELPVEAKALILGACLLLNYMYYERFLGCLLPFGVMCSLICCTACC